MQRIEWKGVSDKGRVGRKMIAVRGKKSLRRGFRKSGKQGLGGSQGSLIAEES